VFKRLPSPFSLTVQSLQQNFQNYFLGQVALSCGLSMTWHFSFKGSFWFTFGLGVGIMTLIPFGDVLSFSLVGLLVTSTFG